MAFKNHSNFDNRVRLNRKLIFFYGVLVLTILSLGIGYASINTQMKINGDAAIKHSSWDVHLDTLTVTSGSVTPVSPATISNGNTVAFSVNLQQPGDYYEVNVNVVNNGTMDAKLKTLSISPTLTSAEQAYLDYTVTYSDDTAISVNDTLLHNQTRTIKVVMKYKNGIDTSLYSLEDSNYNIAITFEYVQA